MPCLYLLLQSIYGMLALQTGCNVHTFVWEWKKGKKRHSTDIETAQLRRVQEQLNHQVWLSWNYF